MSPQGLLELVRAGVEFPNQRQTLQPTASKDPQPAANDDGQYHQLQPSPAPEAPEDFDQHQRQQKQQTPETGSDGRPRIRCVFRQVPAREDLKQQGQQRQGEAYQAQKRQVPPAQRQKRQQNAASQNQ